MNLGKKKILMLAGGGGHTGHAEILADYLQNKADLSFLVPKGDTSSRKRLEPYGHVEEMTKPRHPRTPFLRFVFNLKYAFIESLWKTSGKFDIVICTGSNFCIPPALISWVKGVPLVTLESRMKLTGPSRTAAILQHFSEITVLQWEEQKKFLNGTVYGPLLPKTKTIPYDGGYILVTGGSYGYKKLFDVVSETGLENIYLHTGKIDEKEYIQKHPNWKVFSFTTEFQDILAGASVIITPPGGTAIEAASYRKNIVLVRYPEWTKAGSWEDTIKFSKKINAPLIRDLTSESIINSIEAAYKRRNTELVNGTKKLVKAIIEV